MTDNTAALNEAFESVGTLMASDDTKLTSDILNVAKKVIGALDAVQKVHPYIEGMITTNLSGTVEVLTTSSQLQCSASRGLLPSVPALFH